MLLTSFPCHSEKYLTVCAIFQNEASYIKEWIEYHQLVGVEKFYLYNNSSTDDYLEVLNPYIKTGLVDLDDWPTLQEEPFVKCQKRAYNDCKNKHKEDTTWIAYIDLDEFIVPVVGMTIPSILKDYENQGGLFVYWQNYGTSNLPSIPKDKLLIESLFMKYPWDHKVNRIGKSIVQPSKVISMSLHNGRFHKGHHTIRSDGVKIDGAKDFELPPVIDRIRINHYYTRAEDFFFGVKLARKQRIQPELKWDVDKIRRKLSESNEVKDEIMLKFVESLRELMEPKT